MISESGDRLEVSGAMTFAAAAALLEQGCGLLKDENTQAVFDLQGVREVDSTGLALVFAWQRAAGAAGKSILIVNPPQNLVSLAELYGVTEFLPLS